MSPEALLIGLTCGLGLWTVISALAPRRRAITLSEAIAPALWDVSAVARDLVKPTVEDPLSVAGYVLSPTLSRAVGTIDRLLGGQETQEPVFRASGRSELFRAFRHNRAISGLLGCTVGGLLGVVVGVASPVGALAVGLVGVVAGGVVAVGWVDYRLRLQARVRAAQIAEEFPTVIELLGLALAAGDSLPRALERVSHRARGELGREWARVMAQVELGAPLAEALRDSARNVGSDRVVAFVEHLAQALDRGAPLAEVVTAHSSDARDDYSRGLVEKAGKAEVRMLVPMVLLILPVTVIFAVYPGLQALSFEF
jgi:tight adherence protein C